MICSTLFRSVDAAADSAGSAFGHAAHDRLGMAADPTIWADTPAIDDSDALSQSGPTARRRHAIDGPLRCRPMKLGAGTPRGGGLVDGPRW